MLDLPPTREQECRLAQLENREWIDSNIDQIQKDYADKWIAILDGKIAAYGDGVKEVQRAIEAREAEAVVIRIPKDPIPVPI